jgi:hypothetical protein
MSKPGALDPFQQVHELNRAFLSLLQSRVLNGRSCLGWPPPAEVALASASATLLEVVAAFPRALFQLNVAARERPANGAAGVELDELEHDLCFSILFAARQTSRQSAYQARFLFGLEPGDLEQLAARPLAALQQLAWAPGVLQCAFRDRHWFWQQLLTATRPELRRQLALMALQPRIEMTWPQRRPPQPIA